jgi:hypothetical protein
MMPLHVIEFAKGTPEVEEVQMDLVQGRWQENAMKRVTSQSDRQHMVEGYK